MEFFAFCALLLFFASTSNCLQPAFVFCVECVAIVSQRESKSSSRQEKDISTWSKKSLPEYLFALQELKLLSPCRCTSFDIGRFVQEGPCLLLTPWSHMEAQMTFRAGRNCKGGRLRKDLRPTNIATRVEAIAYAP